VESWTSRRRPRNTNRRAYCRVLKGYGTLVRGRPPNRYGSSWSPAPAPSSEPIALPVFSCCREAIRFPVLRRRLFGRRQSEACSVQRPQAHACVCIIGVPGGALACLLAKRGHKTGQAWARGLQCSSALNRHNGGAVRRCSAEGRGFPVPV